MLRIFASSSRSWVWTVSARSGVRAIGGTASHSWTPLPLIISCGLTRPWRSHQSAARVAASLPYRRWYVIAPDYEYGYNSWTIFRERSLL